ncbi:SDR family oxidoreductase [Streptococcus oricebi]|uniref:Oxidoreductase n=1 Tax=Streptococcus oricebi TaxID=1547447 RepID=A0ABS5B4K7_9STRE|nr:SDR family oxidoreductase [Streptococcus oricebi]MBP2623769.1 oxidoreductase [Streptococcus oricebi]
MPAARKIKKAFVTGATGLLGNNLVRALLKENIEVTALVRSKEKAQQQFGDLPIRWVVGDLLKPKSYQKELLGCDSLFHTAAFFRDNYKGGKHWQELYETNVLGSRRLLEAAYDAGIRQVVHTSSSVVLEGHRGQIIDETMSRSKDTPYDYYRSKILSEETLVDFLEQHPDCFACFVLPSVMFGPGDIGPTSSGQLVINFVQGKLPGLIRASYSAVDARDVADIHIRALRYGRRGQRYLAAGPQVTLETLYGLLEKITGRPAPKRKIPSWALKIYARGSELYHWISKKPIFITKELANLMNSEYLSSNFTTAKAKKELGAHFRPLEETLTDVFNYYRSHHFLDSD